MLLALRLILSDLFVFLNLKTSHVEDHLICYSYHNLVSWSTVANTDVMEDASDGPVYLFGQTKAIDVQLDVYIKASSPSLSTTSINTSSSTFNTNPMPTPTSNKNSVAVIKIKGGVYNLMWLISLLVSAGMILRDSSAITSLVT